jgi:hypothetical protein
MASGDGSNGLGPKAGQRAPLAGPAPARANGGMMGSIGAIRGMAVLIKTTLPPPSIGSDELNMPGFVQELDRRTDQGQRSHGR